MADSTNLDRYRATRAYLDKGNVWLPKGRPAIPITDMDDAWRFNAAAWLLRRAAWFEMAYGLGELAYLGMPMFRDETGRRFSHFDLMGDAAGDAFDACSDARQADPEAWLRTTPLYQALVAGLPENGPRLEALAAVAKHWGGCPVRDGAADAECRCEQLRAGAEA